ncbi:MAG: DTW domain-containing protein [bacterium]|nr:DTW domain-containing protein [bacterium]
MSREVCYRCFWPKAHCWCASIEPMHTRTRFVLLMHPKEWKREKAATGRLTHLCLAESEAHMALECDTHPAVKAILADPGSFPVLLYPGEGARNLSRGELTASDLGDRRLVVFVLDATWGRARKMLKLSPLLQCLPRVVFTASAPSRYVIKRQPQEGCLSTLEAVHETLLALERHGLDRYDRPGQLLAVFDRMQQFHIDFARDPARAERRYHRSAPPLPDAVIARRFSDPAPAATSRRRRFIRGGG